MTTKEEGEDIHNEGFCEELFTRRQIESRVSHKGSLGLNVVPQKEIQFSQKVGYITPCDHTLFTLIQHNSTSKKVVRVTDPDRISLHSGRPVDLSDLRN